MLEIIQLPALADNYIHLVHEPVSGVTAAVDPSSAEAVLQALAEKSWRLDYVFNTHHHGDHTGGNLALRQATGCKVVAPRAEQGRIAGVDLAVDDGDCLALGDVQLQVMATPGHTSGHVVYYFPTEAVLFCGDTLFGMGCGRLFEGTAEQMQASLAKLKALPAHCQVYCAHEYTQANGRFALTMELDNPALQARIRAVADARAHGVSTVPSTLADEIASNPFLRWDSPALQATLGLEGASPVQVFAETRRRKNRF